MKIGFNDLIKQKKTKALFLSSIVYYHNPDEYNFLPDIC